MPTPEQRGLRERHADARALVFFDGLAADLALMTAQDAEGLATGPPELARGQEAPGHQGARRHRGYVFADSDNETPG